jgi:hypothetical protein
MQFSVHNSVEKAVKVLWCWLVFLYLQENVMCLTESDLRSFYLLVELINLK